ncbi:MAG TPA: ACP phosphodiesterase [Thermoanaerobaculia bacterium]|nr:ACP phosphodiesterase [Thermoanaerobaculia bacterium]
MARILSTYVNHLAHLFLAGPTAESLIGNLAGDFVKGPLRDQFTPGIREGIRQHRAIDVFTDTHPAAGAFRRVLIPEHGHYARVIADVFFDHFLAADWSRYSTEGLNDFVARVFATMDGHPLPGRLALVYPYIGSWLLSYREIDGIRIALTNLSRRLSRRPHLERATHHLVDSRRELERRFHDFFLDAIAFAKHHHEKQAE